MDFDEKNSVDKLLQSLFMRRTIHYYKYGMHEVMYIREHRYPIAILSYTPTFQGPLIG